MHDILILTVPVELVGSKTQLCNSHQPSGWELNLNARYLNSLSQGVGRNAKKHLKCTILTLTVPVELVGMLKFNNDT
jgi:hypothetical protein